MKLFLKFLLPMLSFCVQATDKKDEDLLAQILEADKQLFDAFNRGDVAAAMGYFSTDLEFYHDQSGLSGYAQTRNSLENLFANPKRPTRRLLEKSVAVYPVPEFGAIQVGQHTFCHDNNGQQDCGTFAFTHVWKKTQQGWSLSRVMSYNH